ncbi:MAG: class I tRNA ligase family protein, partial [Rhizomicrobium sp.]
LWTCATDYWDDQRIGPETLKTTVDTYRKLRNTVRWMLGNLAHFEIADRVAVVHMPELERLMLHRLAEVDPLIRSAYADFDYKRIFAALNTLMTIDLSAFYFDIRKDALYCDLRTAPRRRAARTTLDEIFRRVATWLAPILCFTMEEAWLLRFPGEHESVHLQNFPATPDEWSDAALVEKWNRIRALRRVVTGALEIARRDKLIGASLEAAPVLFVSDARDAQAFDAVDLAELCITSHAEIVLGEGPAEAFRLPDVPGAAAMFQPALGRKCARCWMILPEVGTVAQHNDLCGRCAGALDALEGGGT